MKVGVVGYGSIGKRHADNLKKLGHQVVVYDPDYDISGVRFERHIYETCPAVVIATPSPAHWGCIRAAAERGCHMLVEKPIATGDIMGLQASLDLATSKGAVVMMGNNLRFHSCVIKMQKWVPQIGALRWASFMCATKTEKPLYRSDGVILNTGSHEVDLALHLLGPAKVLTGTARVIGKPGRDDIADFVLQHENGCRSTFHLDFVTEHEIRQFRIAGSEGDIFCELPARFARARFIQKSATLRDAFYGDGFYADDYVAEMKAFIHRIEGGETIGASGADGLETLKILLDIRKMAGLS